MPYTNWVPPKTPATQSTSAMNPNPTSSSQSKTANLTNPQPKPSSPSLIVTNTLKGTTFYILVWKCPRMESTSLSSSAPWTRTLILTLGSSMMSGRLMILIKVCLGPVLFIVIWRIGRTVLRILRVIMKCCTWQVMDCSGKSWLLRKKLEVRATKRRFWLNDLH